MPITDTSFTGLNEAKRRQELDALMESIKQKESLSHKLAVVILAAGLGKRMNDPEKPKVMFGLSGRPIISYVVELALRLAPDRVIPIVGHHRELVIDYLSKNFEYNFEYAVQEPQLGTGHALMQVEPLLKDFGGDVLILSGDVPLLKYETVEKLILEHLNNNHKATLLTAVFSGLNQADGYGRIVRDANGKFLKIVEDKDAGPEEKKINEINPAIYIVNSKTLFEALKKITPDNKQKEYYLTDIFAHIPREQVGTVNTRDELEVAGVNSVEQLKSLEKVMKNYNESV